MALAVRNLGIEVEDAIAYRRHRFAYPPRASALVQGLLPVADERRQEIAQDRA